MEKVIARETEIAKELLANGEREKALLVLRKKKWQEGLVEKTMGNLLNVETMIDNVTFATIEKTVFESLSAGNETLKTLQAEMSLEEAEKLMMDTEDAAEFQRELEEILGGELTADDEKAIEEEFAEIMREELEGEMPEVPTEEPVGKAEGEGEDEQVGEDDEDLIEEIDSDEEQEKEKEKEKKGKGKGKASDGRVMVTG
eukprot:TRINITY_DN405_c0_g1_i1.p3 TRINITY_DN405_c0_g1~~TRINITY_DN405_c0_g1_i1.p3  ORF type:complete len:200 (-),score=93.90 TRINITY_DN405_c0_g1_i1:819-1418(-)